MKQLIVRAYVCAEIINTDIFDAIEPSVMVMAEVDAAALGDSIRDELLEKALPEFHHEG
jgi:hypothetical protein